MAFWITIVVCITVYNLVDRYLAHKEKEDKK